MIRFLGAEVRFFGFRGVVLGIEWAGGFTYVIGRSGYCGSSVQGAFGDFYDICFAGKILDGKTGDVASDQFRRFLGDIELMANMNVDAYRFSIAWSRIMNLGEPTFLKLFLLHLGPCLSTPLYELSLLMPITAGGPTPQVNQEGVAYYNNLINELLKRGLLASLLSSSLPICCIFRFISMS